MYDYMLDESERSIKNPALKQYTHLYATIQMN